jgi:hypothetical protein
VIAPAQFAAVMREASAASGLKTLAVLVSALVVGGRGWWWWWWWWLVVGGVSQGKQGSHGL